MLPEIITRTFASGASEALSLIWMEVAMFMVAAVGYVLFHGEIPLINSVKRVKKIAGDEPASDNFTRAAESAEQIAQQLQRKVAAGDHLGAFKLWQRVKSLDLAPGATGPKGKETTISCFPLYAVITAMRALGKAGHEIASELRAAAECNERLVDAEALAALLEELRRDGPDSAPLVAALSAPGIFATSSMGLQSLTSRDHLGSCSSTTSRSIASRSSLKSSLALLAAACKRGRLDDALLHLERVGFFLERETPDNVTDGLRDPLTQVLALASRQGKLADCAAELPKTISAAVQTSTVNDLLLEAVRRRDGHLCRQVSRLITHLGVPKDTQTYELLIRGFTSDASAVQMLFEEVKSDSSVKITEALGLTLLHACAANRDAKLAPRVFEALSPAYGGAPDHVVFAALARVYMACELHDKVCNVYENDMLPLKIRPDGQLGDLIMKSAAIAGRTSITKTLFDGATGDVGRHMTMIKACRREGNLQGAMDVFTKLRDSGAQLNPMIYNGLLDACIHCNDPLRAHELFDQMRKEGVADIVSFNIVLKMYLNNHQHDKAQQLLKDIIESGLRANQITYNELLNAKVMLGDRSGTWDLVEEMKAHGVRPNSVTCSIILKALTSKTPKEEFDKTMMLVDQMEEHMDEVLFSCVIEACIRVGKLDTLSVQMRRYARQGGLVALSAQTYGSMIKAYGQAHNVERIWELWNEMEQRQVKLTSITLGCMVDALVTNRYAEEAWNLVCRLLRESGRANLVNNVIYCTVLKGFSMTKQTEHLFAVYAEMRERGTAANTVTYNTLIDACARCGSMHRVPALLDDMKAQGVAPDTITYSTLVKGHCSSGDVDSAFIVLAEMREQGRHKPDEILYNSLLDGCAKEHRLDEALALFERMREEAVPPSNFTLCTMVKLLGRARQLTRAFSTIDEFCRDGRLKPNIQVFTCLLQACIHNRQMTRALTLHDDIILQGCQPDQKTYNVLVRGCLRSGNVVKAAEVVRCSYLLPGHGFKATPSKVQGVEMKVLEELVVRLNQGSKSDMEVARSLVADLKNQRGIGLQDNVYCQLVQRATGETSRQ